jgi:hypothetical protein
LTTTRSGPRATKQLLNAKPTIKDDRNDNSTRSDHEDEDDEEKDDHAAIPKTDKWNTYRGFSKYLKLAHEHGRPFATLYEEDEDEDEDEDEVANEVHHFSSTPGLTDSYASSSPMSFSSDLPSPEALYSSSESISVAQPHGLLILPFGCTPAPQHAQWQRLQIERVSKRMERLKKGEWICARDEDLDEEDPVDELTGDDDNEHFVKPVLKPGEVWDPFGDEYEI